MKQALPARHCLEKLYEEMLIKDAKPHGPISYGNHEKLSAIAAKKNARFLEKIWWRRYQNAQLLWQSLSPDVIQDSSFLKIFCAYMTAQRQNPYSLPHDIKK